MPHKIREAQGSDEKELVVSLDIFINKANVSVQDCR